MQLMIGSQIKKFRQERKLTQEELGSLLGISFQAISKWENNLAYPDITLLPRLAQVFEVSMDELFACNLKNIQDEIESYVERSYRLRETDPQTGRQILEEGLKKYPENEILLNNLLYVLNYKENPDETIQVAGKLIDRTRQSDIKYDALRFLAYAYQQKGDIQSAVAALEQIPEIYFTKLSEMAFVVEGIKKFEAADKQKWISFETMLQMMAQIMEYYVSEGKWEQAVCEAKTAMALMEAMFIKHKDPNFDIYTTYFSGQLKKLKTSQTLQTVEFF